MNSLHDDLLSVLDAVVIDSPTRFAVRDQIHDLSTPGADDSSSEAAAIREREVVSALARDIYECLYVRPTCSREACRHDALARRERVAALSVANTGRGTWSGGWTVREMDADGKLILFKEGLSIWAAPNQVEARGGEIAPGRTARVWIGKEQRNQMPGFYFAIGEAEAESDGDNSEPWMRYYWHLSSEAAVPFVAAATGMLNAEGVPFLLKVLADPGSFVRADAGLVFVRRRDNRRVAQMIARIHEGIESRLRESVPLFTKRLAKGLGAADDAKPSFGEHRCNLAATGLWRSFERGERDRDAGAATLAAVFAEEGIDPRCPYLAPGSVDDFELMPAMRATGARTFAAGSGIVMNGVAMPGAAGCGTISPREAAIRIGESLCRSAVWDATGRYCNWIGRVAFPNDNPFDSPRATAAALGPELLEGSAGVALFLSQLHAATGNDEFMRTADGALARSKLPPAVQRTVGGHLASGQYAGAAMFHLRALIHDPDFKAQHLAEARIAIAAVLGEIDRKIAMPRFDATVRDGLAGLGEVVLNAGVMLEDCTYRERARALGQTLIDRYSALEDWPTGLPGGGPNPSLLLGTAGIGYWLLRLEDPVGVPPIPLG